MLNTCFIVWFFPQNIEYDPLAADRNWETVHALSFDEMIGEMRRYVDRHTAKCSNHGGNKEGVEEVIEKN